MVLPQCSHISRKRGVYYYRRRLGCGLSGEVTVSLRTSTYREAEWLARQLDHEYRGLIERVKENNKNTDIPRIVQLYLKRRLDFDMTLREASAHRPMYPVVGPPRGAVVEDLEWIDTELQTAKAELSGRLYSQQRPLIDEVMEEHNVPPEHRNALAHGIFRANVELWEAVRRRALGHFDPIDGGLDEAPALSQPTALTNTGPLFSATLPAFLDFMKNDKGWRGQTLAQNNSTYRMFLQCCGDLPVAAYQRKDLTKFYDLLRGLPQLYSKSKKWAGLPLEQVVAQSQGLDIPRIAMKTVKRHLSALGVFFAYLKRRGEFTGENPAHGFEFPDKRRARDRRSKWGGEQLRKLFASPVWAGCFSEDRRSRPGKLIVRDEKYWLPILGLFHGNRLEEFAQLRRGDVCCEDGIWFLDINDEDTKQIKNAQSKRRVPIHPDVQKLGFVKYVTDVATNTNDPVFPQLRPGGPDKKLGYFFTKWWTQYRKDIGLYERGLDYHSFRGGVTTNLTAAGVTLEVRNELLGHEGASVDERVYQKGLPLKVLADAIALVQWPEIALKQPITRTKVLPTSESVT